MSKWAGSPIYPWLSLVIHTLVGLTEHFTLEFPHLSAVFLEYRLHYVALLEFLPFFYFAYYNVKQSEQKVKEESVDITDDSGNVIASFRENRLTRSGTAVRQTAEKSRNQKIVLVYAIVFAISSVLIMYIDWGLGLATLGLPCVGSTVQDQAEANMTNESWNHWHFVSHSFYIVMVFHITSLTDYSSKLRMGWILEKVVIASQGVCNNIVMGHPLVSTGTTIVLAALAAIAIANKDQIDLWGDVPFFPPSFCQAKVEAKHECSLLGIVIPCYKTFNQEALEYFGFGLEMCHLWTFFSTFAIGAFYLWGIGLKTLDDWKANSLKVTCAFYAMNTSFFALFRMFWGVSKPLVCEYPDDVLLSFYFYCRNVFSA